MKDLIENPLKNEKRVSDEDMKSLVDEYFRRNPDKAIMEELQSILDAHKKSA